MGKKGLRWKGLTCGGVRWEVETDPIPGGLYSEAARCWKKCADCLEWGIGKLANEMECEVAERGSWCLARYVVDN